MDSVDNSGQIGENGDFSPPADRDRPFVADENPVGIPNPGDAGATQSTKAGAPKKSESDPPDQSAGGFRPDPPVRGADLARDALRSAKESAASRGAQVPARWRRARRGAGRRRGWSGAGPDDRDPQLFGRLTSRLAIERGWSDQLASAAVFARWAELVGSDVAEHATPISLLDGELTVQALSTAWATQLRTLQRQLLARIAAGLGPDVVRRIRVHGPASPNWRKGPRTVRGRGPRDTYG